MPVAGVGGEGGPFGLRGEGGGRTVRCTPKTNVWLCSRRCVFWMGGFGVEGVSLLWVCQDKVSDEHDMVRGVLCVREGVSCAGEDVRVRDWGNCGAAEDSRVVPDVV